MVTNWLSGTNTYVLVLVRFVGMIGLNPVLSRRGVPARVRVGLAFMLTLLVAPNVSLSVDIVNSLDLVAAIIREVLAGMMLGFVFHIFYYMVFVAGDIMDTQFGLAMAKMLDPGTNVQMSVAGNLLNMLFIFYLFSTDCHLVLIHMFASSFEAVPAGAFRISDTVIRQMLELYVSVISLIIRLTLPFVASGLVLEVSMGILMKLIPQIHVFVINVQLKVALGLFLLLAFAAPIASFVDNYIGIMFDSMRNVMAAMA